MPDRDDPKARCRGRSRPRGHGEMADADEVNLVCPSGAQHGTIHIAGVNFEPWHHHHSDGRGYWLIRVPRNLLPLLMGQQSGATPLGFYVAPDTMQDERAS
jgi:hypothetical protein